MDEKEYECAICKKKFYGFGNNPYPVVKNKGARCCDECNWMKVIPARIARIEQKQLKLKGV